MKYKDLLIQLKADIIANVTFVKKYHCYVMPAPETWAMIKGYLHPIVLLVYNGSPVTTEGKGYINYSHLISFHIFIVNPAIKEDNLLGQAGTGAFRGLFEYVKLLRDYVKSVVKTATYGNMLRFHQPGTTRRLFEPDIFVGIGAGGNQIKNLFAMSAGFQMSFLEHSSE